MQRTITLTIEQAQLLSNFLQTMPFHQVAAGVNWLESALEQERQQFAAKARAEAVGQLRKKACKKGS